MMKPLILISNDDGFGSANIQKLADAIDRQGTMDTLIIAPERQRSAASHAITLHKPVRLRRYADNRFALSGTPVDCVYVGLVKLAPRRPSLILSGINRGYNLGTDVFYSGTVAAAVEGGLRGIPSIALSIDPSSRAQVDRGVEFSLSLCNSVLQSGLPDKTILNVNIPAEVDGRYRWTMLGRRQYAEDVEERVDPRGSAYYWIGGGVAPFDETPGTDTNAISEGVISVSPLLLDLAAKNVSEIGGSIPVTGYQLV